MTADKVVSQLWVAFDASEHLDILLRLFCRNEFEITSGHTYIEEAIIVFS